MKRESVPREVVMEGMARAMADLSALVRAKFEHELPPLYRGSTTGECSAMNAEAWAAVVEAAHRAADAIVGEPVSLSDELPKIDLPEREEG